MNKARLVHSLHKSRLQAALQSGLKAVSEFDDLGLGIRQGVIYCWLRVEDDKLSSGDQRSDHVYLEVTVDEGRCTVAEMDYISLAMMYRQGIKRHPRGEEAIHLLAELYRLTAVPLSEYKEGMFFSPEVLVQGDIAPECIGVSPHHP